MPKLRHICALLLITGLLSQVAAQVPLWRLDIGRNEPRPNTFGPRIANDETHVFFLQAGKVKTVDAATGKLLWTFRIGPGAELEYGSGVLVAVTRQGKVFALEPATGRVRWTSADKLPGIYAVDNRTLYIAGAESLTAVNLDIGRTSWTQNVPYFSPFEPFSVIEKRIFVFTVVGDAMNAQTDIFDARTGRFLGSADTRGPLGIVRGQIFFQDDWFLIDRPDEVYISIHSLKTGESLERRTYTIEKRNVPEGSYSSSQVRMDSRAIYISGGGNLACFPLASSIRKAKPDFIRVPRGEVKWVAGPYHGTFVLEWQKAIWLVQRQREKPCSPIKLQENDHRLALGRVSNVTRIGNSIFLGLKSGAFYAVDTTSGQTVLTLNLPTSTFGTTRVIGNTLVVQTDAKLRAYALPQLTSP